MVKTPFTSASKGVQTVPAMTNGWASPPVSVGRQALK